MGQTLQRVIKKKKIQKIYEKQSFVKFSFVFSLCLYVWTQKNVSLTRYEYVLLKYGQKYCMKTRLHRPH